MTIVNIIITLRTEPTSWFSAIPQDITMMVMEYMQQHKMYVAKCPRCKHPTDDACMTLPCYHIYHKECVSQWMDELNDILAAEDADSDYLDYVADTGVEPYTAESYCAVCRSSANVKALNDEIDGGILYYVLHGGANPNPSRILWELQRYQNVRGSEIAKLSAKKDTARIMNAIPFRIAALVANKRIGVSDRGTLKYLP